MECCCANHHCDLVVLLRFDFLEQCPDINPNPGPPGRPTVKIEINFSNPMQSYDDIVMICRNATVRANVNCFAS